MKKLGPIRYKIIVRDISEREFARRINVDPKVLRYWRGLTGDANLPKENTNHPLILERAISFFERNSLHYTAPKIVEYDYEMPK